MKRIVRITERDLHNIVKESVKKVLKESINDVYETVYDLDGEYYVYTGEESVTAVIDTENQYFSIGDWSIEGEEAMMAVSKILSFLKHSDCDVEDAIEQYIYDELR
jgi:hypothetical protein